MPLDRRALLTLLVLPVLALVAGLVVLGGGGPDRAVAAANAADPSGCAERTLKYGVTDDASDFNRQKAFEATNAAVTEPGLYATEPPAVPTLHAASHGSVVVYYRAGLPAAQLRPLRALIAAAGATKAPVIVAPRHQAPALTAIAMGRQLDCSAADAAQTARARAFAATVYPSLKA